MGLYRRSRVWWVNYVSQGKKIRESSRSTNKRVAESLLAKRRTEILEGRWNLPKSDCPFLRKWADEILSKLGGSNTRNRYSASATNLVNFFGDVKLTAITADGVTEFQQARLDAGRHPATVNRDTALLYRLLKLACKRRYLTHNVCEQAERLNERRTRRQAKPFSYDEEKQLAAASDPLLRQFVILLIETGLRPRKEALPLKWDDVDLESDPASICVRDSKSPAGVRRVCMTEYCRDNLRKWRDFLGRNYSAYVFPSPRTPRSHWTCYQDAWERAAAKAGLQGHCVYDCRATFASRANAALATALTLAQLLGHSSTAILPTYAKQLDENTRAVISRMNAQRSAQPILQ
jgi:integrase